MAVKKKKNIFLLGDEKGQAIFEFVIFLPFLIFIYTAFINISSAINGSINQQKATRGYFYRVLLHDSKAPNRHTMETLASAGRNVLGPVSLGWRVKSEGDTKSYGACYKFLGFFGNGSDEECDESRSGENDSNFIKVFTFYGVCGNTYMRSTNGYFEETNFLRIGNYAPLLDSDQCVQQ
ncbi:TadE/TadG family type IV pilus assembly protein [Halobacteriovorax sp. HLS]|uniref:TadE/TadG family type IV pilus assembly protein n=1 Tax=Halobacteriovorax sp. HLS TaxID=2234000 RepID=UPI000FD7F6C1|nr:hypothetical protein [Halobacteriovorax sp. HLS]